MMHSNEDGVVRKFFQVHAGVAQGQSCASVTGNMTISNDTCKVYKMLETTARLNMVDSNRS